MSARGFAAMSRLLVGLQGLLLAAWAGATEPTVAGAEVLGRALFFDTRLSKPPGQACATCHDPARAFSDPRQDGAAGALSRGADGVSVGDRNTPALTYVGTVPPFHRDASGYVGGLFLDGRAHTLNVQALEPLLNPLEMALPDADTLTQRVLADETYQHALKTGFGTRALAGGSATADAITAALAAFERTMAFSSFDSRFDRYLAGTYRMTKDEALGRELFFSDLINCNQCHLNAAGRVSVRETFTNHRYHNIGVPVNVDARRANGLGTGHRDLGLGSRADLSDAARQIGRFRVPSLRNVAVTAPYMHNGAFRTLSAAVAFYGQFLADNRPAAINPDTGAPWGPPEVAEGIAAEVRSGQPLDERRIEVLVAFLKTLTDARYEHLIPR